MILGAAALCLFTLISGPPALADTLKIATFNTELHRKGPGILLRDITRGKDRQVIQISHLIARVDADIILLQGVDFDAHLAALSALRDQIAALGPRYPHLFALRPNTGRATGLDMDGNGRLGQPRDAQGYGRFAGQGGMAILSKFPINRPNVRDFSAMLWRDLPGATLPTNNGRPFPSELAQSQQRLSSVGHWDVPILLPDGTNLHVLAFHATPPVFDGPEDRNGLRNHDEIALWLAYLDGALGPPPEPPFVIIGDANQDPYHSDGRKGAIRALLADPRIIDPKPISAGAAAMGHENASVYWPPPLPGPMRVDYVLPSTEGWVLRNSQTLWLDPEYDPEIAKRVDQASRHRLVWVEMELSAIGTLD